MNRHPPKEESTNPGASHYGRDESTVIADGATSGAEVAEPVDEDEFPSETTRIDPNFLNGVVPAPASPRPAPQSLEALAAQRAQARAGQATPSAPPPRQSTPVGDTSQRSKLAALKSLSLDGGEHTSSTRLPPAPRPQSASKLPWLLLAVVLGGVGYNYWRTMNHDKHPDGNATGPVVKTERAASSGGTGQSHVAAGYTNAQVTVSIATPSGGTIKAVNVQPGDKIKRGQVLVTLDASAAQAELDVAAASVRDAERLYSQTARLRKLESATEVEVNNARGAVEVARSKLRPIQQRIDQARIRAPGDATVLEVLVHPGEGANAAAPVLKVADLTKLVAEVDIQEADLTKIHRGQSVDITSDTTPDTYHGTVGEIAESADRAKGTVQVKVYLQVPDQALRPNISVKCTFLPMQGEKARMMISKSAIRSSGEVWIVGADRVVTARAIKAGAPVGNAVEVLSGLKDGDEIVSDANAVHENQKL